MRKPTNITNIERAFYNMATNNIEQEEYFFIYYAQKLVLFNHIYNHMESHLKGFTEHDQGHIMRILKHYEKMLRDNIPEFTETLVSKSSELNFYEIFILLSATIWHDVGNIKERKNHQEMIEDVQKEFPNFIHEENLEEYVNQVAKAHRGDKSITDYIKKDEVFFKNESISLRFLGALLRFADELEEGEVRIDSTYFEKVKKKELSDEQKIHWKLSDIIKRITPNPHSLKIEIKVEMKEEEIFKLYNKDGEKIALIDELIFKINEINNEREYYMEFARRGIEFNKIELELCLIKSNNETQAFDFNFNRDRNYSEFWKNFPQLNPEENMEYKLKMED